MSASCTNEFSNERKLMENSCVKKYQHGNSEGDSEDDSEDTSTSITDLINNMYLSKTPLV